MFLLRSKRYSRATEITLLSSLTSGSFIPRTFSRRFFTNSQRYRHAHLILILANVLSPSVLPSRASVHRWSREKPGSLAEGIAERSVTRVHGDSNMSALAHPSQEDLVLLTGQTNELIINLQRIMKQKKSCSAPAQEAAALRAHTVAGRAECRKEQILRGFDSCNSPINSLSLCCCKNLGACRLSHFQTGVKL